MAMQLTVTQGPRGCGRARWVEDAASLPIWITVSLQTTAIDLYVAILEALTVQGASFPPETRNLRFSQGSLANRLARADRLGTLVGELFSSEQLRSDALVLEGADALRDDAEALRFVESMVRAALQSTPTFLITEFGSPFTIDRLREAGTVREVGLAQLALTPTEARQRVQDVCRLSPDDHADAVWTAMVDVASGHVAMLDLSSALLLRLPADDRAAAIRSLGRADDPLSRALEMLSNELTPAERNVIRFVMLLGDASLDELADLGIAEPEAICDRLLETTLLRTLRHSPHRFAASRLLDKSFLAGIERPLVASASKRALGRGDIRKALVIATDTQSVDLLVETLSRHGAALVESGHSRAVLEAVDLVGAERGEEDFAWLEARAAHELGDTDRALGAYGRANALAARPSEVWRHGLLLYVRGDVSQARAVLEAKSSESESAPGEEADRAMVAALAGSAAWLMSDIEIARSHREAAFTLAPSSGAEGVLAAAHTLAALVAASDGDRVANDWHYVKALGHAEQAGDLWQVGRIRINRGSRLLEEGEYQAGLVELDEAVRSADLGGFTTVLAMALTNRADIGVRLGQLDEARVDVQNAVDLLQEQGSPRVAYPLGVLARLFVVRGDIEQAVGASERALGIAERVGDRQATVSARVQLARALAERDPNVAIAHIAEAVAEDSHSLDLAEAWVTMAVLSTAVDDMDQARNAASQAAEIARERRDRFSLAQAIEAAARFDDNRGSQLGRLGEASGIFRELGCRLDEIRIDVRVAQVEPTVDNLSRVRAGADLARRLGARPLVRLADEVIADQGRSQVALEVNLLGSFSLIRGGQPVHASAWQSRKARDLFKMLATRRGRPLTRDQAIERLWPDDEDRRKSSQKLSVALATLRSVLDPDKEFEAEHFLRADSDAIRLDFDNMLVDVDNFFSMAAAALAEYRTGNDRSALTMLEAAEANYHGDLLEDDPYVDWYVSLREEARLVYFDVARALADLRSVAGELSDAVRLMLRILQREPYDEGTHLDMVRLLSRSGRHGDAQRAYGRYVERMRELEIEPASFPTPKAT